MFSLPRNDRKKHVSMPINICKLRNGGGVQQNAVEPAAYKPMILRCRPAVQT